MATTNQFMEYLTDQLSLLDGITNKKMFGEYGVYYKEKIIGLVCNDMFFLKPTEAGKEVLGEYEMAPPYDGSKEYILIGDLENRELLKNVIVKSYEQLPIPKLKKKK